MRRWLPAVFLCAASLPALPQSAVPGRVLGAVPDAPGARLLPGAQAAPQSGSPAAAGGGPGEPSQAPPDPRRRPPARPGALTLSEVLAAARGHNPALLAARANLDATRAQEIQAGARANPNFGIAGQEVTLGQTNPASPYTYSAQVSRLFERGHKREWRLDGARAATAQTADQLRDQTRGIELGVKQQFTAMLVAKAALALAEGNLSDFRREVEISRQRYGAGDLGRLDFERLDLQLAQFESDRSNAVVALREASDQLQTLMGVESPNAAFDIAGEVVPPELGLDLAALDGRALAARPDYQAALAGVEAAAAGVKLAYANGTSDPTLEGEYERSSIYNSFGFNFNVPVRIFDRNQGNKKTSEFALTSSRFAVVAAKNQVLSDVDQAWIGYTESRALSARYGAHYLDEAADVLAIARFAFEHGGLALIDYLDALRGARQTASDALNAYQATWLAIHQVSYAAATEVTP